MLSRPLNISKHQSSLPMAFFHPFSWCELSWSSLDKEIGALAPSLCLLFDEAFIPQIGGGFLSQVAKRGRSCARYCLGISAQIRSEGSQFQREVFVNSSSLPHGSRRFSGSSMSKWLTKTYEFTHIDKTVLLVLAFPAASMCISCWPLARCAGAPPSPRFESDKEDAGEDF